MSPDCEDVEVVDAMKLLAVRLGMPVHEFSPVLARSPELQLEVLLGGSTLLTGPAGREESRPA